MSATRPTPWAIRSRRPPSRLLRRPHRRPARPSTRCRSRSPTFRRRSTNRQSTTRQGPSASMVEDRWASAADGQGAETGIASATPGAVDAIIGLNNYKQQANQAYAANPDFGLGMPQQAAAPAVAPGGGASGLTYPQVLAMLANPGKVTTPRANVPATASFEAGSFGGRRTSRAQDRAGEGLCRIHEGHADAAGISSPAMRLN